MRSRTGKRRLGPASRQAYTLLEVVLVLALIVMLSAIIVPSYDAMYGDYRLTAAADMVRAAWASARAHAMEEGRPYVFAVVSGKGNFRIAPEGAEYWAGNAGEAREDTAGGLLLQEEVLPKGVRFSTAEGAPADLGSDSAMTLGSVPPTAWSPIATFLPDGTAREDVVIEFQTRGSRPRVLKLRGLTGSVTTPSTEREVLRP